ncbi:hypothetical protein QUF80_16810 [Desulfococcaceae bacterium HSG8]|nr:hypothetical protein [Desulfococcaceae bacterium HSG8]
MGASPKSVIIRKYTVVKNGQLVLNLPEYFEQSEVEVIVLPKHGADFRNAFSEKKTKRLGILKGKAGYAIRDDFKLTDEEFLGNEVPA